MGFAERDRLLVGKFSCSGSKEDEGLVAEIAGGDIASLCQWVICGKDGYERFGEEGLDDKSLRWVAVTKKAGVKDTFEEAFHDLRGIGLVKL
jgi:hypothetical protein